MLQSAPFNYRRVIIWIGRLVLGAIFVYAGFAKLLMPNTHLWPYFFLKFSVSTNLTMFQQQVESYKMLSPEAAGLPSPPPPFVGVIAVVVLVVRGGLGGSSSAGARVMWGVFSVGSGAVPFSTRTS